MVNNFLILSTNVIHTLYIWSFSIIHFKCIIHYTNASQILMNIPTKYACQLCHLHFMKFFLWEWHKLMTLYRRFNCTNVFFQLCVRFFILHGRFQKQVCNSQFMINFETHTTLAILRIQGGDASPLLLDPFASTCIWQMLMRRGVGSNIPI